MSIAQEIDLALAQAVAEVNGQQPRDRPLTADDATILVGEGGVLDSLGLLSFLVAVEQGVEARCGVHAGLVGSDLGDDGGPLATVGQLKKHLLSLANDR